MRAYLAPFFIGRVEAGLDRGTGPFDEVLPAELAGERPGSIDSMSRINRAVAQAVASCAARREKPMILCGDCMAAIGCLAGLERAGIRPFLVWFDAHGDFHTHQTTLSGHPGGMPLAMITGRGDQQLLEAVGLTPLADRDACLIGGRDLEPGERELLAQSEVLHATRLAGAIDRLPRGRPLWVHFDTDYVSAGVAPAQRYPAGGGPSVEEVEAELAALAASHDIIGLSVSGWAPALDPDGSTAAACWRAVAPIAAL